MDIPQLAAEVAKFLAPFLPYLIAGTKAAAEEAGRQFGKAAWEKAAELWGKLKPKVEASPDAKSAVEKAMGKPEDKRLLGNLEYEFEQIFNQDIEFAQSIKAGNYSLVVGRDLNNSKVAVGEHSQAAETINNYFGVSPSGIESDKQQKAFHSYLEKLRRHCNALPLAALGGDEKDEEITLDKIYIDLDTTSLKGVPEEVSEKEKGSGILGSVVRGNKTTPISVMEIAVEIKQLVLLGEAGAGKSTFVKKLLAMQAAVLLGETKDALAGFRPDLIPVLVVLRDLCPKLTEFGLDFLPADRQRQAFSDAVLETVRESLTAYRAGDCYPMLEEAFENGKILLVLDGLDEVPQDLRERVRLAVGALIHLHKMERIIITSRSRSYTGLAVFPNFQAYTIAPFDREKIQKFAIAWYNERCSLGHLNQEQAGKRADDLAAAAVSEDLIEMSGNPMMLTSIAIIHQKDIGLPRERVRLYRLIVDVLIRRWQTYKTGEENFALSHLLTVFLKDDNRLRSALEALAYEAHRTNYTAGKIRPNAGDAIVSVDLSRGQALTLLESSEYLGSAELASEFLDYVDQRSGLLVGKGGELERPTSYSFPHRTIQEYLAGCYLVGTRNRGREFWKHAAEGDFWSLAAMMGAEELYYNHDKARDILLDMAYYLCPDAPPQTEQTERALLWSGQIACLFGKEAIEADAGNPSEGKAYLGRLIPRMVDLFESRYLTPRERAEAGNTLARLGDPRPGVTTDFVFCEIPAGIFKMGSAENDESGYDGERPQFEYNIPNNYFMSRYPVTNAQFEEFVRDPQGYRNDSWWTKAGLEWRKDRKEHFRSGGSYSLANHPVVGVTWYEAAAFCNWLNDQFQVSPFDVAQGKGFRCQVYDPETREIRSDENLKSQIVNRKLAIRLPTEAEWERAARGALPSPDGRGGGGEGYRYPWKSDEITPDHANYADTNLNATSAVGAFPKGMNDYGLLDMSGNVWEWCATEWQDNYKEYLAKENNDLNGDLARVLRGGAYNLVGGTLRCAGRNWRYPNDRYYSIGFRVVVCVVSPISP